MGDRFFTLPARLAFVAVMGFCTWLLAVPALAQPVTHLNVMSFNVLVAGQRGLGNIAEAIRRSGADVVGLQEMAGSPAAIAQLATNLGFHTRPGLSVISRYPILGAAVPGTSEVQNGATLELNPGPLTTNTTFSWRVDEVTPGGVITGGVWTFSTLNPNESTVYEWTFDQANLDAALGNGVMSYADPATAGLTSFGTTDGTSVPHVGGQPAGYLGVPAFTAPAQGYLLTLGDSGPNGGGGYLNRFTFIFDVLIPSPLNWTPLFNSNPQNANDADWYVDPTGRVGIGDLGYSSAGAVTANTWQRLTFAADLGAGVVTFYRDGVQVRQRTGASLLDGRFALYSNLDGGPDVLLFNEGDPAGTYTHPLCVNSVAFTDRTLSAAEIAALGGPRPEGIFVRKLRATLEGPDVSLAWSGAANTRLQREITLSPAGWQEVPGTSGASQYTQPATNSPTFFRLVQP